MSNENIDNKKEYWINFYKEATILRKDFADRGWETIKLFFTFGTSLLLGGTTHNNIIWLF